MNNQVQKSAAPVIRELRLWLVCLLMIMPSVLYYVIFAFFSQKPGLTAAGFLDYDHMIHMATAREYFDSGFHLAYGNPASPSYDTARIYFQPSTLLLGSFWKISGLDVSLAMALFGFFFSIICARGALELYREIVGFENISKKIGLLLFFWGGGIMALTGFFYCLATGTSLSHATLFICDPVKGEWCLNFGRNLISPLEACYHTLFVWCMVCVLRKRFRWAALLAFITSLCHPFTGAELLAILLLWALFERYFLRSGEVPLFFVITVLCLCAFHFGYYMVFLKLFKEHAILASRWALYWVMDARSFVPAYFLVGLMALAAFRNIECARKELSSLSKRLALVWFCTAFMLVNHHILIDPPMQPLHFTRGYVWTSLFFLGSTALIGLLDYLLARKNRLIAVAGIILVCALFLCDNALWLSQRDMSARTSYLSSDEKELLGWMNGKEAAGRQVLSVDLSLNYHAILFSPLRVWCSHIFNTPEYDRRSREMFELFTAGAFREEWAQKPLLVIFNTRMTGPDIPAWVATHRGVPVFSNRTYRVYAMDPVKP